MCHMGHQLEELFGSGKNPDKVNKFYDYFLTLEIKGSCFENIYLQVVYPNFK